MSRSIYSEECGSVCASAHLPTYITCSCMTVHTILYVHMCLHACVHTPVSAHVTLICVCVCVLWFRIVKGNSTPAGPGGPLAPILSISHLQGHRGQLALSTVLVPPSGLPLVYGTSKRGADWRVSGALPSFSLLSLVFLTFFFNGCLIVTCFLHTHK